MGSFRQGLRQLLRTLSANVAALPVSNPPGTHQWEAESCADRLLIKSLSAAQRAQFESCGYFEVTGGVTRKRYRIRRGCQMNVEELDQKGRRVRLLCFVPEGQVPIADVMLAQKIALELFEPAAISVAHQSPVWDDTLAGEIRIARRFAHRYVPR